jgi:hypothetical protein
VKPRVIAVVSVVNFGNGERLSEIVEENVSGINDGYGNAAEIGDIISKCKVSFEPDVIPERNTGEGVNWRALDMGIDIETTHIAGALQIWQISVN